MIEAVGLRKRFRRRGGARTALDGLDLHVAAGEVHGFLGPNGSGKTTTIRMLLGLVRPDSGELRLFGEPVPRCLPRVIGRVGALVEAPMLFPSLSGRETLRLHADSVGLPRARVEEVLDLVGLRERAGERVAGYSLGMKQRLGIASALLERPELVILDEPGNGLDPAGLRDVRDLARRLADGGATVFLSSHLLGEVEAVCDRVTVVARGRCVATGPVGEVLAGSVRVRLPRPRDPDGAARLAAVPQILAASGWRVEPAEAGDAGAWLVRGVPQPEAVSETLARHGLFVSELAGVGLEAAFLELTGGGR